MYSQSVLPSDLKSFSYYLHKVPLYLRNSYGFIEHFRIWYDFLVGQTETNGIVPVCDTVLNLMNVYDKNYLDYINSFEEGEDTSDFLDKLASIFGVTRRFNVKYNLGVQSFDEFLNLNNNELLILIKAQIIRNYCNGTYEQIQQYYADAGLAIYQTTVQGQRGISNVSLISREETEWQYSENIRHLFYAGLLTIQNVGIIYSFAEYDISNILIWDVIDDAKQYGWGGTVDGVTYAGGQWQQ